MVFPNFLVIGAQKGGSSWLDVQLRTHPDIYLPTLRKEVHFFDEYYDRGWDWYGRFFPSHDKANKYIAIGEVTPKYIYDPQVPYRIREKLPDCKFIAVLRHPVKRAYSQYGEAVRNHGETRDFQTVLNEKLNYFERGLYYQQLARYLELFPRENMLILVFEHVIADPQIALGKIAEFLRVSPEEFDMELAMKKVNAFSMPRFPHLRAKAKKVQAFFRYHDMDWIVRIIQILKLRKLFELGSLGPLPPMDSNVYVGLLERYEEDIRALEKLLDQDLAFWLE